MNPGISMAKGKLNGGGEKIQKQAKEDVPDKMTTLDSG
jgi:hypothetical protein